MPHRYSTVGSSAATALGELAQPAELLREPDQRVHDLDQRRLPRPLARPPGPRARSRAPASRRSRATASPSRQPRVPSIGFASRSCSIRSAHLLRGRLLERRQELVQRRVEQADGHRQPRHRLEDPLEVALLHRAAAGRAPPGAPPRRAPGSSPARSGAAPSAMNMCSVRQSPMPSAPNSRAFAASSGVSAFARTPSRRSPSAQPRIVPKFSSIAGRHERDAADDHPARAAVDGDQRHPRAARASPIRHDAGSRVDLEHLAARDARLPHPAGDDRGVRGHAAVRREDAARLDQPVDVVRRRLPAHEDDALPGLATLRRACPRRARSRPTRHPARRSAPWRRPPRRASGSIVGWSSWSSWPGRSGPRPPRVEISPRRPSPRRSAAPPGAVRLPVRVWSRYSVPSSTVNSMSCMSR